MESLLDSSRRVVITGIGLATPLGLTGAENVARCQAGKSAISAMRRFESEPTGCRAGAVVPEFDLTETMRFPKNHKFMSLSVRCAFVAAREAIGQSGIGWSELDPRRAGLYTASGQTGLAYEDYFRALDASWAENREMDFKYLGGLPSHLIDRYIVLRTLANGGLGILSMEFGIQGPNANFVQGDTASAHALSCAYHDLVEDRCDVALAGGHECLLNDESFVAYEQAGLLSHSHPSEAYRPFDRRRDGLVLGAGSGFLVLERLKTAVARGASILGEVYGVMETGRAWSPHTLRAALQDTTNGQPFEFVIGRGIGLIKDDAREAHVLGSAIGSCIPVSALKSLTGYLGAATAIVELGIGLLCARQGFVPPIAHHDEGDPECTLNLVKGGPRRTESHQPLALFLSESWCGNAAAIVARASAI